LKTDLKFAIPEAADVKLEIYDALGRVIETLINEKLATGNYSYYLNAPKLSSGVYFYRLSAGNFVETKKFILLK